MNKPQVRPGGERGRIKPIFRKKTFSFDVIDITETTAVLEFVFDGESKSFFDSLRRAGYEGLRGRFRLIGLHKGNAFETGIPAHILREDFDAIVWTLTGDPSDGVVLEGTPG